MNVYLIEDNTVKSEHLPSFVKQMEARKQVCLSISNEWRKPTHACRIAENLVKALEDRLAIILLDYDMQGYETVAATLMSSYPDASVIYSEWQQRFNGAIGSELASAVLAVASLTGSRVLICSTVHSSLPNSVLNAVMRHQPSPISWPTSSESYDWPNEELETVALAVQSHWRAPYDKAARLWEDFSDKMKALFPTGDDEHHVWWHLKPENINTALNRAATAFQQFAESWANAGFGENLSKCREKFSNEDFLHIAKTADNNDGLPVALICDILSLESPAECRNCKADTNGVPPGAILLALMRFKTSRAPAASESVWGIDSLPKKLRIYIETHFEDAQSAIDAVNSLELTPTKQIEKRGGNPPGQATLAMDYLRKLDSTLAATDNYAKIELFMRRNPIP